MEPTRARRSIERGGLFFSVTLSLSTLAPAGLRGEATLPAREEPDCTLAALARSPSSPLVASPPEALGPARRVTLVWYDVEARFPSGLDAVSRRVTAFCGAAGLDLTWRKGELGVGVGESETREVPITLLSADPAPGPRPALGATRAGGPAPRPVWIFLDPLWTTLGQEPRRGALTAQDVSYLARPLARVIAHELVHSLGPGHEHASSGLMKRSFSKGDLLSEGNPGDLDLVLGWPGSAETASEVGRRPGPVRN